MPESKVHHIVRSVDYDWIALYGPDGNLIHQGHSIQEEDLLRLLGVSYTHEEIDLANGAGEAPNTTEELEAIR